MFWVGKLMEKERSRIRQWSDWPLLAKGMVVVVLPLLVLTLSRIPLYQVLVASGSANRAVVRTANIQRQLETIQGILFDAESGVRGYMATREHVFLEPYDAARIALPAQVGVLGRLLSEDAERANATRIRDLSSTELTVLNRLVTTGPTMQPGERDSQLNAAHSTMDQIRRLLAGMRKDEEKDLRIETGLVNRANQWARTIIIIGVPIALAGGFLGVMLFARGIRRRILVLGDNATSLAAGDPLPPTRGSRDEIGRLDSAMRTAGALLAEREARLSLALEAGRFLPFESDPEKGSFTFHYPEQMRTFGFSGEDVPTTLAQWEAVIHPEDRERVALARSRLLEHGGTYDEEYRIVSPGGAVWWVDSRARLDGDSDSSRVIGVILDVTPEKLAERDRIQTHQQLTKVFHASPVPIAIISGADGTHLQVNKAWCRLTGYTKEEALGQTALELDLWENAEAGQDMVERLGESGGSLHDVEVRHRSKSGEIQDTLISLETIEFGDVPATILMIHDMTKRKRAEEALRRSLEARSAEDERHRAELAKLSITDDLTNLLNPRGFRLLAEHEFAQADRTRSGLVLLFADLDDLKHINDTLGHATGSRALADAADLLRATFRDSDVLARVGGDEFCVLLSSAPSERAARMAVSRLRKALVEHNAKNVRLYTLSLSIGAARRDPGSGVTIEQMTEIADAGMYREKVLKRGERKPSPARKTG